MKEAFSIPGIALCMAVNFLVILSFTNLDQTFTFFCADVFGIDERGTGYVLASIGVVAALVQGGLTRPLSRRFADASIIRAGALVQAFAFAALVLSATTGRPLLFAGGALLAVGNGLTQPSLSAFISTRAPANAQGATLGVNQSFASLARTFGPALGGWLYGVVGHRAPYSAAAIGLTAAFALALALRGRLPSSRHEDVSSSREDMA
jgi:MFS family permease